MSITINVLILVLKGQLVLLIIVIYVKLTKNAILLIFFWENAN